MIIHWTPCFDHLPISWTQVMPDVILISRGEVNLTIDFSDPEIVEYDIPLEAVNFMHRAWREAGVLHLGMPSYGPLHDDVTIDYGVKEELTWQK